MPMPGMGELFIILVIVLIIFGGGKIAGVGRSMGTAIKEFKDAVSKDKDEDLDKDVPQRTEAQMKSIGENQADKAPVVEGSEVPVTEKKEEHLV